MKFTRSPLLPLMLLCAGSVLLSQVAVWVAEQSAARARGVTGPRANLVPETKRVPPRGADTVPPERVVTASADEAR